MTVFKEYIVKLTPKLYTDLRFRRGEEIVRCRDCEHSHITESGKMRCHGHLTEPWDYYNDAPSDGAQVEPDGFCKWASRRES